ncbi:uncharacterized protein LOC121871409 isoform X2 [Homarus americanus]|uniref:uncharacterized protein LOC121871409 isoform X2 n=1 Tax=Homarus americanus TaxID=6706 RepID=UPI001C47CFC7|nr:uncharacterized protein LOC121871409 isoform X2 [Homarus americanus]
MYGRQSGTSGRWAVQSVSLLLILILAPRCTTENQETYEGCVELDDDGVKNLTLLEDDKHVYIKRTSVNNATAILSLPQPASDNETVSISIFEKGWRRLRLHTRNVSLSDNESTICVSVLWTDEDVLAMFETSSPPTDMRVLNYTDMSWAIGCPPGQRSDYTTVGIEVEVTDAAVTTEPPVEVMRSTEPPVEVMRSTEPPEKTTKTECPSTNCDTSSSQMCLGFSLTMIILNLVWAAVVGCIAYHCVMDKKRSFLRNRENNNHQANWQVSVGPEAISHELSHVNQSHIRPSITSCHSNNEYYNDKSRIVSFKNADEPPRMHSPIHPPLPSLPPPTLNTPTSPHPPTMHIPTSLPPPPTDSTSSPPLPPPIDTTHDDQDDHDDNEDDDYDYPDFKVLQKQISMDKMKKQPTKKEAVQSKEEVKEEVKTQGERMKLSSWDSDNSLYVPFIIDENGERE